MFAEALAVEAAIEASGRCVVLATAIAFDPDADPELRTLFENGLLRVQPQLGAHGDPQTVLQALDVIDVALKQPAQNNVFTRHARVQALLRMGRHQAARGFSSQFHPPEALKKLLDALPPGPGPDPSRGWLSAAAMNRPKELNVGHRLTTTAATGKLSLLQALVTPGTDVDTPGERFFTALAVASLHGFSEMVTWLLQQRADPEKTNDESRSALMLAADAGHAAIASQLVAAGASVKRVDQGAQTALHLAGWQNHVGVVQALLAAGAPVGARDLFQMTPLMLASSEEVPEAVALLLRGGSDVNASTREGTTALMTAAMNGHARVVGELLRAGADRSRVDFLGRTARAWAEQEGHSAVARLL